MQKVAFVGEVEHGYITPKALDEKLRSVLRRAGIEHPAITKPEYVWYDREQCLKASAFRYASVLMPRSQLESYELALRKIPGVVKTEIIQNDNSKPAPLRDQVVVYHLRNW
jgi:hypothetical protein